MDGVVLNPSTRAKLDQIIADPTHAILISAKPGMGKSTLSKSLASSILGINTNIEDYPYCLIIKQTDKNSIGIDAVRKLEKFLSLKVPVKSQQNRVVIIKDAHLLTIEAQNSLLKNLEEPPAGTVMIMTTSHDQALLPTIRSRVQSLHVAKPDQSQITKHFLDAGYKEDQITQAYSISGGLPALMSSLLSDSEHPLLEATKRARTLLGQTSFERLLSVDELSKQRQLAKNITFILKQMSHISLQTASQKSAPKWQKILEASYAASEALNTNAQPKLTLTKLMLSL